MDCTRSRRACVRALILSMALVMPTLTLAQQGSSTPTHLQGGNDGFRARLQAAAWLYEELEYEQALEALSQAKALAKTHEDRLQVALYEGIVLADLGQRAQSLTAFREALGLKLDARLPVRVSPKVEQDFEAVRDEVRNERFPPTRKVQTPSDKSARLSSAGLPPHKPSPYELQDPTSDEQDEGKERDIAVTQESVLQAQRRVVGSSKPEGLVEQPPRNRRRSLALLNAGVLDLHGPSRDMLIAVGGSAATLTTPSRPRMYRLNPATGQWLPQNVESISGLGRLWGIWVVNTKLAYSVGERGSVLQWNGTHWRKLPFPNADTLTSVMAFGPSSIYVTAYQGRLYRYDGQEWHRVLEDTSFRFIGIDGASPANLRGVAEDGRVIQWP